jgi:hypothetical protein
MTDDNQVFDFSDFDDEDAPTTNNPGGIQVHTGDSKSPKNRPNRETRFAGRPPKNPHNKVGLAVRCMVTDQVKNLIDDTSAELGVTPSDFLRLAIYHELDKLKKDPNGKLRLDATFDLLRKMTFI